MTDSLYTVTAVVTMICHHVRRQLIGEKMRAITSDMELCSPGSNRGTATAAVVNVSDEMKNTRAE